MTEVKGGEGPVKVLRDYGFGHSKPGRYRVSVKGLDYGMDGEEGIYTDDPVGLAATFAKAEEIAKLQARVEAWEILCAWGGTPEAVHDFIKGQQNRIHAAQEVEKDRDAWKEKAEELAEDKVMWTEAHNEAIDARKDASRLAEALSQALNCDDQGTALEVIDRGHKALALHKAGEGKA